MPIGISFMSLEDFTPQMLENQIARVSQSKRTLRIDKELEIKCKIARVVSGWVAGDWVEGEVRKAVCDLGIRDASQGLSDIAKVESYLKHYQVTVYDENSRFSGPRQPIYCGPQANKFLNLQISFSIFGLSRQRVRFLANERFATGVRRLPIVWSFISARSSAHFASVASVSRSLSNTKRALTANSTVTTQHACKYTRQSIVNQGLFARNVESSMCSSILAS